MSIEDRLREHLRATEVELDEPAPQQIIDAANRRSARTRLVGAGAGLAVAAGLVVGVATLRNDPSVVDVAEAPATTVVAAAEDGSEIAETVDDESPAEAPNDGRSDAAGEIEFDVAPADPFLGLPGPSTLVGVDDGIVGLRVDDGDVVVLRSEDGVAFSESAAVGFEPGEVLSIDSLLHQDGVFTALVYTSDQFDGGASLAVSSDLMEWTVVPLPPAGDHGGFVQSIAARGSTIVAAGVAFPAPIDPTQIAIDLGVISEAVAEDSCGVRAVEPTDPIEIESCSSATPLAVVEPGTPAHAELLDAVTQEVGGGLVVWTGETDGSFAVQQLSATGYASPTVMPTDTGFLLVDVADGLPVLRRSPDGIAWSEPAVAEDAWIQSVAFGGGAIAVALQAGDLIVYSIAGDTIETSAIVPLGADHDGGWISRLVSGPAGVAVLIEAFPTAPDLLGEDVPDTVTVEVDGWTLTAGIESGAFTVLDPDGRVVHDLPDGSSILEDAEDLEGVARFDGPEDERLVILDPETGEDLFTVTQDMFIEAMGLQFDSVGIGEMPERRVTLLFSPDGTNWRELDGLPEIGDELVSLEAVGDDEVIVRIERLVVPPDALFALEDGTEPSAADAEAIAESERAQRDAAEVLRIPTG